MIESLLARLENESLLLILDNCEHLVAETAHVVEALLAGCPRVRILATSREPLRVSSETCYRLPSLNVEDALALFHDRARAVDHSFTLNDENALDVGELCRSLDGIPLAIELAAARVNVLSILALTQMLDDRFRVLGGGERTALPRQQTMRATIAWSYDLLSPQEQLLLARLSIFVGGFAPESVESVCSGDGVYERNILDLLTSLTEKSLVVADPAGEYERYRLLVSTKAYALGRLDASGERERVARRHAEHFCEHVTAEVDQKRGGPNAMMTWLAVTEHELDNYRAALDWALGRGNDLVLGGAIAGALGGFWWKVGLVVEGRHWIDFALPRISESEYPAIAARLQFALSVLSDGTQNHEAAERALELAKSAGDARGAALALGLCGRSSWQMGRLDRAREQVAKALAELRACGDTWNATNCLGLLGLIAMLQGELRTGRDLFAQALSGWKATGDKFATAGILADMAEAEFAIGAHAKALSLAEEALELASQVGNPLLTAGRPTSAMWHVNTAAYRAALGDIDGSRSMAREGLHIARKLRNGSHFIIALQHLAFVAAFNGSTRSSGQLLGYVNAQYGQLGARREYTEQWGYDKLLAALRETLSDDELASLAAEGATWSQDQAMEEALKM